MKQSIIIPCSRPDRLPVLLAALPDHCEILVVTPEKKIPDLPQHVRVVQTEQLFPPGRMRNSGAARADGEILFFIDDDCIPGADWFTTLLAEFGDKNLGIIGCRLVSKDNDYWSRCADYVLFTDYQHHQKLDTPLGSAAIGVRKEAFEQVGGFDETLYASEDWDFCLQLMAQGWICRFDPSVEVIHDHQRSSFSRIHRAVYLSGFRSGLTAQKKNYNQLSWLARLSVVMSHPLLYALLMIPYALAVGTLQFFSLIREDRTVWRFFPWIYTGRLAYHFGVWCRLLKKTG